MSHLVAMLVADLASLTLGALSVAMAAAVVAWCAYRGHRLARRAAQVVFLALDGRTDEARIQARSERGGLAPLVEALSGVLSAPSARPLWRDAAALVSLGVFPALLFARGLAALDAGAPADRIAAASALLGWGSVLLPVIGGASLAVVELGRGSARAIRGSCVSLLAKSVRAAVDAELNQAHRRALRARDPRGD